MGWLSRLFGREGRSAAHIGDPALAQWFGGEPTASGISVTVETALRCPAVYAPIRLLAGTVSILPLEFFTRTGDSGREAATDHPLYDLLHARPNGWQTSAQFRRLMTESLLSRGNAYAVVRRPGAATAIEPVHGLRMLPYRDSQGRVWYRHTPKHGPALTLHAEEVLHLRYGPPKDDELLVSASPIDLHRETIALALAATEYLGRFFANYAVPKGALHVKQVLTPEAKTALRKDWEKRFAGLKNAHRLAILDGDMELKQLGMTNTDAQFLELYRQISSDLAAKIWGIPPHLIGDTEKQTSWGSGIEQMNIGYVVHTVQPILEEWEQSLDATLLSSASRRRHFFEYNVDGLLRGDFKARMEGFALMVQWGMATPNEVRRKMNLPPLTGGDSRLQPLNMAPAEKIMDVLLRDVGRAERALAHLRAV